MEPFLILIIAAALTPAAILLFLLDKNAARTRSRRIPEAWLLAISLLGGWPGSILAIRVLRHKSRKRSFQAMLLLTIVAHIALLTAAFLLA